MIPTVAWVMQPQPYMTYVPSSTPYMPCVMEQPATRRDLPDRHYPTNASYPQLNDWGHLSRQKRGQGHCNQRSEQAARDAAAAEQAKKATRKHKHELFAAVIANDVKEVQRLLDKLPSLIQRRTPYGATPLCVAAAASSKDTKIIELLLEKGADVTQGDGIGATALIFAASKGNTNAVHTILNSKQGGNAGRAYLLNQRTHGGETAFIAAAKAGHLDTLRALLGAGSDTTACTKTGADALMLACRYDRVECARFLMSEVKLKATAADSQGRNALMYAAAGGAEQAMQLLLSMQPRADVNQLDKQGCSALHIACTCNSVRNAEALVAAGAALDPNDKDMYRQFVALAAQADQPAMLSWLLCKASNDKHFLVEQGPKNPMFAAVRAGSLVALETLLAAGARTEVTDHRGRTPLALAARLGHDAVCRVLVSKGANLLAVDDEGLVPRQLAHKHEHRSTAQLLSELARAKLIVPDSRCELMEPAVPALV